MTHTYAAYKRPISEQKTTQTESEGLETNILRKWTGKKKSLGSNTHIRQKRVEEEGHKRDPEDHFIKKNPSRRHKYCKHICTQHNNTQIYIFFKSLRT